jgi:hypothetical protein
MDNEEKAKRRDSGPLILHCRNGLEVSQGEEICGLPFLFFLARLQTSRTVIDDQPASA